MPFRTDENNNPTAFTTDLAAEAGLILGQDYSNGTPFPAPSTLITALLLGDPIATTIRVIDKVGFYTYGVPGTSSLRWGYIAIPFIIWSYLTPAAKKYVIGFMYLREGGVSMRDLFLKQ